MPKIKPVVARTPESLARTLGLSAAEAQEWRFQHDLLSRLKVVVKREAVTHADLARRAATSRPRVTAILNGDLEHVSSDLLIRLLAALGYRVRAVVSRTAA
jgi:predicted XRE-type DNA-binding protein